MIVRTEVAEHRLKVVNESGWLLVITCGHDGCPRSGAVVHGLPAAGFTDVELRAAVAAHLELARRDHADVLAEVER
jgi:hypothetical protein